MAGGVEDQCFGGAWILAKLGLEYAADVVCSVDDAHDVAVSMEQDLWSTELPLQIGFPDQAEIVLVTGDGDVGAMQRSHQAFHYCGLSRPNADDIVVFESPKVQVVASLVLMCLQVPCPPDSVSRQATYDGGEGSQYDALLDGGHGDASSCTLYGML